MIVNLNTTERSELNGFKPQHALTALLNQFYSSDSPGQAAVKVQKDVVTLYNDLDNQKRALAALDQVKRLKENSDRNAKAITEQEKLYTTFLKIILNKDMRKLVEAQAESV
jgi:predicted ribosome quality control (RQC) complex YloA/Tae2 family protein